MIKSKKETGTYYTPSKLAKLIVSHLNPYFDDNMSVLEPSAGDGVFISAIAEIEKKLKLTALDINEEELKIAKTKNKHSYARFINKDFLDFSPTKKFGLILGNPPYIKKSILSTSQLEKCREINSLNELPNSCVKNLWITFLLKSVNLLSKTGLLAFMLPSDLLQHKYSDHILNFLKREFERIEIVTFDKLLFDAKGQDTILVIGFKKHAKKGVFFGQSIASDTKTKKVKIKQNSTLLTSNLKWTHHFLSSEDIEFLTSIRNNINSIQDISNSKPGIVTAANKYFIVDKAIERKYNLSNYTEGVIQKGVLVNGKVTITIDDFKKLEESNKPTRLLVINSTTKINKGLKKYLAIGQDDEIHKRYKCRIRESWYSIPNVKQKPKIFFFKRSHLYPKLLLNNANVHLTDSAYYVAPKKGYKDKDIVYSFYNSLTLLYAELCGRYYGGGVLELTPSEFKSLPIPYTSVKAKLFNDFKKQFRTKKSINEVLARNDLKILCETCSMNNEHLDKIQDIRTKLLNKRLRI